MGKKIVYVGISLGIIVFLASSLLLILCYYLNSSGIKQVIARKLQLVTGFEVTISGTPFFTIYPQLGVRLGEMRLEDAENKKNYLIVQNANVGIKLSSLLEGKIESANILLYNLFFHIKDKYLVVDQLLIDGSDVNFSKAFPLKIEGEVSDKNFILPTQFTITSEARVDLKQHKLYFNDLKIKNKFLLNNQSINIFLTGNMQVDLDSEMISCANVVAYSDGVLLHGKFHINNFISHPEFVSTLDFQLVDPIKLFNLKNNNLKQIKNLRGKFDLTFLHDVNIQGYIDMDKLDFLNTKMKHVQAHLETHNQHINVKKFSAQIYEGDLSAEAELSLSNLSQLIVHMHIANMQIAPFLSDNYLLAQKVKLSGIADMDVNLTSHGYSLEDIENNLTGKGYFKFTNGYFSSFALTQLINSKYNAENIPPPLSARNDYTSLTGKFILNNRNISGYDLTLETKEMVAHGKSIIDLNNYSINYTLQAQIKDHISSQMGIALNSPVMIADINQTQFF